MRSTERKILRSHTSARARHDDSRKFMPRRVARGAVVALAIAALAWPGHAPAQITQFSIPTPSARAGGITLGPDGALWFTEGGTANKIGRITTDGSFFEYPIPASNSGAIGITAGPDGALWFTEGNANKIGRKFPTGNVIAVSPTNP